MKSSLNQDIHIRNRLMNNPQYIRWFSDIDMTDLPLVGGKNASLGELYRLLAGSETALPDGFALTASAYRAFLDANQLNERIFPLLDKLDKTDLASLHQSADRVRQLILAATLPAEVEQQVTAAYQKLCARYGEDADVAVRSSATAEDLPGASFAGQQDTFLNIRGSASLLHSCKQVFASLFTDRAISYRVDQGFDHRKVALSIGVQRMVRSDLAASGVMFTLDTESGFRDLVLLNAAYGLGESVVQGTVSPDEFLVFKPLLDGTHRPIVKRQLGEKASKMIYMGKDQHSVATQDVPVPEQDRYRFCIDDDEVLALATSACAIERHYSARAGHPMPMDIEWAKDGNTGRLFILQARPETVHSRADTRVVHHYRLKEKAVPLVTGKSVGKKIASGRARIILHAADMASLQQGEVLVTDITDPDWEPVMKKAAAIVTNRGGRVCHAAIVARELGIPAVVGTGNGLEKISDGAELTVSCAEGDAGYVYPGLLPFEVTEHRIDLGHRPKTHIMMNVADPQKAFEFAQLPNEGVGLARLEFIINNLIGIHPRAVLKLEQQSETIRSQINRITAGYPGAVDFYVDRMAEGVGAICAAFYPKPVIIRFSDFKTNEYRSLLGGEEYEPEEENPMLGFRGATRYLDDSFAPCFALECAAVKQVRERMGLTNLAVMVPFVRTPDDLDTVKSLIASHGLVLGEHQLKLYTMCEIPANVILAEQFLARCDGFSIGSNDLTQLTLGVDRDSALLSRYDERNEAVKRMIKLAIDACLASNKYVGICGQAPSDFPEITQWLVEQGISSISLNPDSVIEMTELVLKLEQKANDAAS